MARWKLLNSHYLNVPGEEWERVETDRQTGRPIRTKFPVPRLLDPSDPSAWTNRWGGQGNEDGEIIVCHEGKGEPRDQIFTGNPTPDMVPLDDEAKEISKSFEQHWAYKPDTADVGFSQSLMDRFQLEMAEKIAKPAEVTIPGLSELAATMSALVKQNADLMAASAGARRV